MDKKPERSSEEFEEIQIKEYRDAQANGYHANPIPYAPQGQSAPAAYYAQSYPPQFAPPPSYPQPSNYPPPNVIYQQAPGAYPGNGPMIYNPEGPIAIIQEMSPIVITDAENKILKLSRYLRYAAIINIIVDVLYAVAIPGLLLLFILNIIGYFGARMFNVPLCVIYCVYLGLMIILRIFLMIYYPWVYLIVIFSILCVYELMILMQCANFVSRIRKIGPDGRYKLSKYVKMSQANMCCWYI